jgi:hypothetical protein
VRGPPFLSGFDRYPDGLVLTPERGYVCCESGLVQFIECVSYFVICVVEVTSVFSFMRFLSPRSSSAFLCYQFFNT